MRLLYLTIKRQPVFFAVLGGLLFTGMAAGLCYSRTQLFLAANIHHSPLADIFFLNYTFLGDGLFLLLAAFFLLMAQRVRLGIQIIAAYLLSGFVVQVIKHVVAAPRPRNFFPEGVYNGFISGLTRVGYDSFPSGHTASAFVWVTLFSLYTQNRYTPYLLLALGMVTGYSRVYLGNHFVHDVVAGAGIGILSSLLVYAALRNLHFSGNPFQLPFNSGL